MAHAIACLPPLPGYEGINRFWNKLEDLCMAKILPGEFYVTFNQELICTTLGSCISACIWDKKSKIGGMNHFMLPQTDAAPDQIRWSQLPSDATRYGNYAMEHLINEIIKHGGCRTRLQAKVFGGGNVLNSMNIGQKNIDFVLNYLKIDNIPLIASDLGNRYPRKLIFDPLDGKARVKWLTQLHNNTIFDRENSYQSCINNESVEGEIELF